MVNSVEGVSKILESGSSSFNWKGLFGGFEASALIIFVNACILIHELRTTNLTMS
jgi:hypothetical protein